MYGDLKSRLWQSMCLLPVYRISHLSTYLYSPSTPANSSKENTYCLSLDWLLIWFPPLILYCFATLWMKQLLYWMKSTWNLWTDGLWWFYSKALRVTDSLQVEDSWHGGVDFLSQHALLFTIIHISGPLRNFREITRKSQPYHQKLDISNVYPVHANRTLE